MSRCIHCDSEAVMPKSGLCLSCGAINTAQEVDNKVEPVHYVGSSESAVDSEMAEPQQDNTAASVAVEKASETKTQEPEEEVYDQGDDVLEQDQKIEPSASTLARKVVFPKDVENKAQLTKKYKKVVNSCQYGLEKLKGELIAGDKKKYSSFMLTSANRKEGGTVSSLAIAIGLSRFGRSKVLLIDANAINPSLQDIFSINDCDGFTEYISNNLSSQAGQANDSKVSSVYQVLKGNKNDKGLSWAKCSYYTEYDGLYVMPYSKGNAASLWELLEDKALQPRLDALKQVFDYVVLDAASIMSSSESAVLSQYVDGVVLVIKAEQTKWEIAELAVSNVRKAGGVFLGAILNRRKFYIPKFLYGWI